MAKVNKNVKNVTIKVTERCIKNGSVSDAACCPIALALRSQRYTDVNVGGEYDDTYASSRTGKHVYEFVLPKVALNFIERFDSEGNVKPFTFTAKRVLVDDSGL